MHSLITLFWYKIRLHVSRHGYLHIMLMKIIAASVTNMYNIICNTFKLETKSKCDLPQPFNHSSPGVLQLSIGMHRISIWPTSFDVKHISQL